MQDKTLKKLANEVNRCNTIFNESAGSAVLPAVFELRAAEERLRLYLQERRIDNGEDD